MTASGTQEHNANGNAKAFFCYCEAPRANCQTRLLRAVQWRQDGSGRPGVKRQLHLTI